MITQSQEVKTLYRNLASLGQTLSRREAKIKALSSVNKKMMKALIKVWKTVEFKNYPDSMRAMIHEILTSK